MSEKKEEKGGFVVHVYSAGNQIIQTQTNNYYGTVYQGRKELVSDDEVVNLSVDKAKVTINENENLNLNENDNPDDELLERLRPIFYNNEEDVRLFLKKVTGMMPNDITDLVNRWVEEKRISDYGTSRKGALWKILYDAGLYTKTRQNWNRRVE